MITMEEQTMRKNRGKRSGHQTGIILKTPIKKTSENTKRYIRQLLELGLNNCQVAKLTDLHPSTVGDWRDKMGLNCNRYDAHSKAQIKELYESGQTQSEIAKYMGLSRQRVNQVVRDLLEVQVAEKSTVL